MKRIRPPLCPASSAPPPPSATGRSLETVGKSLPRLDARAKVTGEARYVADLAVQGMLYAAVRASDRPHAEFTVGDLSPARSIPGVRAVITAADIPGENQVGIIFPDQPLLAKKRVRYLGDRIALVAADTLETARAAARLVPVSYRDLPVVSDVEDAVKPGSYAVQEKGNIAVHQQVYLGDVDRAFLDAAVTVENTYRTPWQEHAYLETQGVLAVPDGDRITLYASCQCPFYIQKQVSHALGIPFHRVRVIQSTTGGAFGGKEDYPSEPASCAAVLACKTGRPVRLVYEREEDVLWTTKRHPMVIRHRLAANAKGRLLGAQVEILVDAGPYLGLSGVVAERANVSVVGPYRWPAMKVDTYTVYTNNLFGGPFRGFGSPQVAIAHEAQMDLLARRLGMDPVRLREINALRTGDTTGFGQTLTEEVMVLPTLKAATEACEWAARRGKIEMENTVARPRYRRGLGLASVLYGCNLHAGGRKIDRASAYVMMHQDGSVSVSVGLTDMGQGLVTVTAQIAAEALGIPLARVRVNPIDTHLVPDSGPTVASRGTIMSGLPVIKAAQVIRQKILERAATRLGIPVASVEISRGMVRATSPAPGSPPASKGTRHPLPAAFPPVPYEEIVNEIYTAGEQLTAVGWYRPPRPPYDFATGLGAAYNSFCYATQVAEVTVDTLTGRVTLDRFWAAHDIGQAINPQLVESQIEGGVVQGMGYALTERLQMKDGYCLNRGLTDYLIPTSRDIPQSIGITLLSSEHAEGPYRAKGIGEPSLTPVAATIRNAVTHALGIEITELPMVPEKIRELILAQARNEAAGKRS